MKIYRTKSSWEDEWRVHVPSCTVMSQEPVERFSGLYDASGNRLYSVERAEPAGFIRFGEKNCMTDYLRPTAWAGYCISGNPGPFVNQYSIRATRREVQRSLGEAHADFDQTPSQGWKRAYRNGWRCVKVRMEPLGELPQ